MSQPLPDVYGRSTFRTRTFRSYWELVCKTFFKLVKSKLIPRAFNIRGPSYKEDFDLNKGQCRCLSPLQCTHFPLWQQWIWWGLLSFQCTHLPASEPSLLESGVIRGIPLRNFIENISHYTVRIVIKPPNSWLATEMRSQRSRDEMKKDIMELCCTQVQFPSLAEGFYINRGGV